MLLNYLANNTIMKNKIQTSSVLLIYTGGTIGMVHDHETGTLKPFDVNLLLSNIPVLKKMNVNIEIVSLCPAIDSSDMQPEIWKEIALIIKEKYEFFDGFVILHGSDTMAYTASALSFMLNNLDKPVILTGSQLPIGLIRTDARENLVTSIEIAAAKQNTEAMVPEVCLFFENHLYRGNRTSKRSAEHFDAFVSPNYPPLAIAGVSIRFNHNLIRKASEGIFDVCTNMDTHIALLKIYPGIRLEQVAATIEIPNLKAIILETFGSGNAPMHEAFIGLIKKAIDSGVIVLNITQCLGGAVVQGKYQNSKKLLDIGVVGGGDMTTEAAVTKLMFLLGKNLSPERQKRLLASSLCGELTGS